MRLRLTLFISLVALFYMYCNEEEPSNIYIETNDINMIEMPVDQSPTLKYESIPQATVIIDSSYYFLSSPFSEFNLPSKISMLIPRHF